MANLFLVTLFICSSVKYASSIQCYVCDSVQQPACLKDYSSFKKSCAESMCGILKGLSNIVRICGATPDMTGGNHGEMNHPILGDISWSTCQKDLCNWGIMNKFQMITLILCAMSSLSFYYKF